MARVTLSQRLSEYFHKRALIAEKERQYKADTKYMSASQIYNYGVNDVIVDENNLTSKRAKFNMKISKYLAGKQTRAWQNSQSITAPRTTFPKGSTLVDKKGQIHNYATGQVYPLPYASVGQLYNMLLNPTQQAYQRAYRQPLRPQIDYSGWVDKAYGAGLPEFANMAQANEFAKAVSKHAQTRLGVTDGQRIRFDAEEMNLMNHAMHYVRDYKQDPRMANYNQTRRIQFDRSQREHIQQANMEASQYDAWVERSYQNGLPQFSSPVHAAKFKDACDRSFKYFNMQGDTLVPDPKLSRMMSHAEQYRDDYMRYGGDYASRGQYDRMMQEQKIRTEEAKQSYMAKLKANEGQVSKADNDAAWRFEGTGSAPKADPVRSPHLYMMQQRVQQKTAPVPVDNVTKFPNTQRILQAKAGGPRAVMSEIHDIQNEGGLSQTDMHDMIPSDTATQDVLQSKFDVSDYADTQNVLQAKFDVPEYVVSRYVPDKSKDSPSFGMPNAAFGTYASHTIGMPNTLPGHNVASVKSIKQQQSMIEAADRADVYEQRVAQTQNMAPDASKNDYGDDVNFGL